MNKILLIALVVSLTVWWGCTGSEEDDHELEAITFEELSLRAFGEILDFEAMPGKQVGWVISSSDENIHYDIVTLLDEAETALNALMELNLDMVTLNFGFGVAVCSIEGVGSSTGACFGPLGDPYWAFYHLSESRDSWVYSDVGVLTYDVRDGEVLAFVWTD